MPHGIATVTEFDKSNNAVKTNFLIDQYSAVLLLRFDHEEETPTCYQQHMITRNGAVTCDFFLAAEGAYYT